MYLVDEFRLDVSAMSEYVAWVGVPIVLANLWLTGFLSGRFSIKTLTIWSAALTGVFMIAVILPQGQAPLWPLLFLTGAALAVCLPSCATLLSNAADPASQGRAMGNNQAIQVGAEALSGLAAGLLAALVVKLPLIALGGDPGRRDPAVALSASFRRRSDLGLELSSGIPAKAGIQGRHTRFSTQSPSIPSFRDLRGLRGESYFGIYAGRLSSEAGTLSAADSSAPAGPRPPRHHAGEDAVAIDEAMEQRGAEMAEEGREKQKRQISVELAQGRIEHGVMGQDGRQMQRPVEHDGIAGGREHRPSRPAAERTSAHRADNGTSSRPSAARAPNGRAAAAAD